jgi:hypothetical protein
MERTTIHQLVAEKNKALENMAIRNAGNIIEEIAQQQQIIALAEARITDLREQLNALEVKQIDAKQILGE